jgi:hypothetical protein
MVENPEEKGHLEDLGIDNIFRKEYLFAKDQLDCYPSRNSCVPGCGSRVVSRVLRVVEARW